MSINYGDTMRNTGKIKKILCGGGLGLYEMAYREWGNPNNPNIVLCVHGLTRNSLDFCQLAEALSSSYRVIAPDVAGRGLSDKLIDPMRYDPVTYTNDIISLINHLGVKEVDWVGTSMGGLMGMMLACQKLSPIRRLILNDVGPTMSHNALERITNYVSTYFIFKTKEEAYEHLRKVFSPMALENDEQWHELFEDSIKTNTDGTFSLNYDPNISLPLKKALNGQDIDLWPLYNLINVPTLLIHGENSDLLSSDTALQMTKVGAKAKLVSVPGVGHAPMFKNEIQINIVNDFLKTTPYAVFRN